MEFQDAGIFMERGDFDFILDPDFIKKTLNWFKPKGRPVLEITPEFIISVVEVCAVGKSFDLCHDVTQWFQRAMESASLECLPWDAMPAIESGHLYVRFLVPTLIQPCEIHRGKEKVKIRSFQYPIQLPEWTTRFRVELRPGNDCVRYGGWGVAKDPVTKTRISFSECGFMGKWLYFQPTVRRLLAAVIMMSHEQT